MELLDAVLRNDAEGARDSLARLGFARPKTAFSNLRRLLAGGLPPQFGLLLGELTPALAENPDPDRALNNLERFHEVSSGPLRPARLAAERPFLLGVLVALLGHSQFLSDVLIRYPHYLAWLGDEGALEEATSPEALEASLRAAMAPVESPDLRRRAAVRWLRRSLLRAGVRELAQSLHENPKEGGERRQAILASERAFMEELSAIAIAAVRIGMAEAAAELRPRFGRPIEENPDPGAPEHEAGFAVLAMGKLGGLELNFSSDIDLVFLYSEEGRTTGAGDRLAEGRISNHEYFRRLAERLIDFLTSINDEGYLYRVDTRLRPDGAEGPLARSLPAFEIYHETQARLWERLALVRARAIGGDLSLRERLDRTIGALTYDRPIGEEIIAHVRELKETIDAEVNRGADALREIKRGPGGIREIEFFVQTHQLLWARETPALRTRSTLEAIEALAASGRLEPAEADRMSEDYLVLRRIEHRLQMMDLRQTHTLPSDPAELERLGRRCGLTPPGSSNPGAALLDMWSRISGRVHGRFVDFFDSLARRDASRPEVQRSDSVRAAEAILAGAPEKDLIAPLEPHGLETPSSIATLKRLAGRGRSVYLDSRGRDLLAQVLPGLIEAAGATARPAAALAHLESFLSASGAYSGFYETFAATPALLDLLLKAFGRANSWAKTLIAHPEYADYLLDPAFIVSGSTGEQMSDRLEQWLESHAGQDPSAPSAALARLRRFEALMTGLGEVAGSISFPQATARLTLVADLCVAAALGHAQTGDPAGFAVLAMGKHGTGELNYFSDLDLIFCWDDSAGAPGAWSDERAASLAQSIVTTLTCPTPDGAAFSVDARLRPEGRNAPLAPPLSRYRNYYASRAEPWEFQSFMKVRHVAGDPGLSRRLIGSVGDLIAERIERLQAAGGIAPAMAAMRRRIERSVKIPKWVLCDFKKGPGGVIDLEFLAQYFQLLHFGRHRDLLGLAPSEVFARMEAPGVLAPEEVAALGGAYRFLREFESRARLLLETDRSRAPAGGEKLHALTRATADLIPAPGGPLNDYLLKTLQDNRRWFDQWMGDKKSR